MPSDKVTISLFSTEGEEGTFNPALFREKDNITRIKAELTAAACVAGMEPPDVTVSILLIPNWKKSSAGYDNPEYLALKRKLFSEAREVFSDMEVQDFYIESHLSNEEKQYLHKLQALGSHADIIKNRAIINNRHVRHLQMDSNTKILNWKGLYQQTFLADPQCDALNASYYDHHYVSAHNKIVYCAPGGFIAEALEKEHISYCSDHCDDYADKIPQKNSIYSRVFAVAMNKIGLTRRSISPPDDWVFYPAIMEREEYRITPHVVTAVNMSWSANLGPEPVMLKELKALPPISVGDASCDYACVSYLIKKYTGDLWQQKLEQAPTYNPRAELLALSVEGVDKAIIAQFYNQVVKERPHLASMLASSIPETTEGDALAQALFHCNARELHEYPFRISSVSFSSPSGVESTESATRLDEFVEMKRAMKDITDEVTENRSPAL